ncbi:ATP-dependent DNA helicase [Trichonephila clavata]|uniref:ATP-dependent DNA helicase n=1 Tax=Trichonephila clavata TaxID=2740835 RepID=A0A8X6LSA8_TRICU|nr:ATP-dependent DNA helicase [Trichonephila clavata]
MVVITEHLENLNISREYNISRPRVYEALRWLINNNPLYQDVIIDNDAQILQEDLIRVTQAINNENAQNNNQAFLSLLLYQLWEKQTNTNDAYKMINNSIRVLRASWHQGNNQVFNTNHAGSQCCAMVLANITRAAILAPHSWTNNILNTYMLEGDAIYAEIRQLSIDNPLVPPIDKTGYLEICHFGVIRDSFVMYSCSFRIVYDEETDLVGCLRDSVNKQDFRMTLKEALTTMFTNHKAGVLIATSKSLGVMNYNDKYYFTDSHACGPNGASASDTHGKACVVECGSLDDLIRVCKRATGSEHNLHQSSQVTYPINTSHEVETNLNQATQQYQRLLVSPTITSQSENERNVTCQIETIPVHTSVMAPIDSTQPTEEQVLDVSNNVNKITRKTTDNIVNVAYEWKAEEFAWFFLLPYRVNGLNQPRNIKISPLDYFQYRILGNNTRFQRNDYLFYALSMFEHHRVKSTISACCKKVEGQDGKVDDVHLYLKSLRGSAAYWRTSLNELLAQI